MLIHANCTEVFGVDTTRRLCESVETFGRLALIQGVVRSTLHATVYLRKVTTGEPKSLLWRPIDSRSRAFLWRRLSINLTSVSAEGGKKNHKDHVPTGGRGVCDSSGYGRWLGYRRQSIHRSTRTTYVCSHCPGAWRMRMYTAPQSITMPPRCPSCAFPHLPFQRSIAANLLT